MICRDDFATRLFQGSIGVTQNGVSLLENLRYV